MDHGQRAQMMFRRELQAVPGDDDRFLVRSRDLRGGDEIYRPASEEADALLRAFASQPLDHLLARARALREEGHDLARHWICFTECDSLALRRMQA